MILSPPRLSSQTLLWAIQRGDGVGVAMSSHDRPLTVGGVKHGACPGLVPSNLLLTDRLLGSSMTLKAKEAGLAGPSVSFSERCWRGAAISLASGDWSSDAAPTLLCSGEISAVRTVEDGVAAEIDLVPSTLREQPCPQTSPECRATLGDKQCRVDMRARTARLRIIGHDGDWLLVDRADLESFHMGRVRWVSGRNAGFSSMIVETRTSGLRMRERSEHRSSCGDWLLLMEGCDGRLSTCSQRFHNVANFRGEPHLPGTDLLTRYPGD